MVQEAAAPHLNSPIEGKQVSGSASSMWPVLALGILTAIFAWIWYRGSGERKEPETPVQKQDTAVTTETGQQNVQSKPSPLDASLASSEQDSVQTKSSPSDASLASSKQESVQSSPGDASLASSEQDSVQTKSSPLPSLASNKQESVQSSPEDASLTSSEQESVQTKSSPGDANLASSKQDSVQSSPGDASLALSEQDSVHTKSSPLPSLASSKQESVQTSPGDASLASGEQECVQSKPSTLNASLASSAQESVQSNPGDTSLASGEQECVQSKPSPLDASLASSEQESAQTSPLDTDLTRGKSNLGDVEHDPCEHGVPWPKIQEKKVLNPGIDPTETKERETSDVDPCGSDLEVQSNVIAKGNPPVSEQAEVKAADQFSDVASKVHLEGDLQEHKNDQVLPGNIQECPTDVKEPLQGHLTDVKEDHQEHLTDVTKLEELHGISQEQPTSVSVNEDQELLKDVAHTNAESCPGLETHSSGVLDAGRTLLNGDQGFVVQANGEAVCPTALAPEAQKVLSDSCNASSSDQGSGLGEDIVHQDEVYGNQRMNGADDEVENGPGGQLENSFFVKESGKNVLESGETLKQDLYPEINMSSDFECAIVTDKLIKDESIETCDIKRTSKSSDTVKPSSKSQENAGVFDGSLNASFPEALCDFQNLGTYPESSSMEIYSMFNQEKVMSGLSSSNTNEKNSVYSPSEANGYEADNQKTKKVATIQPMPQNVNFGFKVHYITHSDSQIIAVTGDHEKLGKWETYVPLISENGGFWSHSMTLPADINVAWKFIMVENGKINRWEECNNRLLKIAHEDIEGQLFWGYPCHKI